MKTNFFDFLSAPALVKQHEEDRFISTCANFLKNKYNVNEDAAYAIAHCLFARMNDARLHYHTPIHVLSLFDFADDYQIHLQNHDKLAIWFHDAIYEINSAECRNETSSVDFMIALLQDYLDYNDYIKAAYIIEDTTMHLEPLKHNSSDLVLDLDLSNFAYNREMHNVANQAVRKEYSQYSDQQFATGRLNFLKKFLNKGFIYRTPLFKDQFETIALTNIEEDIKECQRILT